MTWLQQYAWEHTQAHNVILNVLQILHTPDPASAGRAGKANLCIKPSTPGNTGGDLWRIKKDSDSCKILLKHCIYLLVKFSSISLHLHSPSSIF